MNEKQIIRFLEKHTTITAQTYLYKTNVVQAAAALSEDKKEAFVLFDTRRNRKLSKWKCQAILLHELGHLATKFYCPKINKSPLRQHEFAAHRWALNVAKKKRMAKVFEVLVKSAKKWAKTESSDNHKYVIKDLVKAGVSLEWEGNK